MQETRKSLQFTPLSILFKQRSREMLCARGYKINIVSRMQPNSPAKMNSKVSITICNPSTKKTFEAAR